MASKSLSLQHVTRGSKKPLRMFRVTSKATSEQLPVTRMRSCPAYPRRKRHRCASSHSVQRVECRPVSRWPERPPQSGHRSPMHPPGVMGIKDPFWRILVRLVLATATHVRIEGRADARGRELIHIQGQASPAH